MVVSRIAIRGVWTVIGISFFFVCVDRPTEIVEPNGGRERWESGTEGAKRVRWIVRAPNPR